jgi:acyl carrier protein
MIIPTRSAGTMFNRKLMTEYRILFLADSLLLTAYNQGERSMKQTEFFELLMDALEVESVDELDTEMELTDLEEYDSLAVLSLIALIDEHFGKRIAGNEFQKITTVQSLMDLIGSDQFEV